jgi:hypothetical protein
LGGKLRIVTPGVPFTAKLAEEFGGANTEMNRRRIWFILKELKGRQVRSHGVGVCGAKLPVLTHVASNLLSIEGGHDVLVVQLVKRLHQIPLEGGNFTVFHG